MLDFKKLLKNFCTITLATFFIATSAEAQPKKHKKHNPITNTTKNVEIKRPEATLVADASTGKVLYSENAERRIYPASLTKMMTIYLAFDALKKQKVSMHTMLPISKHAQNMRPSKLGLVSGQKISVGDAVMGLIVKSANDAAVTIAEGLGGSEKSFAHHMNKKAKELGMDGTHFVNASGWHDSHQVTTAVDMAKLGLALKRNFPEYYHLFKKTNFTFKGKVINGHNHVLAQYTGAEGLKTGYTGPAGFNLVTTASRNGMSLIAVVTGRPSAKVRDRKMMNLLDEYFGVERSNYVELASNKKEVSHVKHHPKKKKHGNTKIANNMHHKSKKRV